MLGVCYYPEHWPKSDWPKDAKRMRELGLSVVRLGEFAWSRLEPKEGQFEFAWLDEVIDILFAEQLNIVLGTPTATPPRWLLDKYSDLLPADLVYRQARGFGSRRHYDLAHQGYRQQVSKICRQLAERYGSHPALLAWQLDNELGCHDTTQSGSLVSRNAFQKWCQKRYQSIDELNHQWGNVFWSMEYQNFEQIDLPIATVTESNPAHQLAYRRFCSDLSLSFVEQQVAAIREHSTDKPITHNFIPLADTQFDYFQVSRLLDFASYDNYPLGRTDLFFPQLDEVPESILVTGHPDLNSFYLAQVRALKQIPFWIMEQQPGPVNWAKHNPRPRAGMVRLWTWEAIAHGAEKVCYFRWRQAAFGQEQMHAGLLRVDGSENGVISEINQIAKELQQFELEIKSGNAKLAIVLSVENQWITEIEKLGAGYVYDKELFAYYTALRGLGLDVDFISPDDTFDGYELVIVPCQCVINQAFVDNCKNSQATFVFGPRSGAKTAEFNLERKLAPGFLQELIPIKVLSTETLRPEAAGYFEWAGQRYQSRLWREQVSVGAAEVLARNELDEPVIIEVERFIYLTTLTCKAFIEDFFTMLCQRLGIEIVSLPPLLRVVTRGQLCFAFNYSDRIIELPMNSNNQILLGNKCIPAYDLCIWQKKIN